jgi:vitamin B12 transporter
MILTITPSESNPDGWDDGIPSEQNTDQKGAQAQVSANLENSLITAGLDWVNYKIETTWDPKESEYDNPALFLLAKTKLFDQRFIISGGLRYDEYKVEMKEGTGGTESDDHLSPRFGAAYLLTDNLKLRANYGEAFKMPSAKQLAGDFTSWWIHYVGNPNLKPETSKTYEGGLDFSYDSFNTGLTLFHTDFKDKIQTASTSGGDITWENVGKAEIAGVEADFSYDIGSAFAWDFELKPYVSFVYLTEYKDKETDEDLQYTASGLYGFSANLNFAYTGKQWITDYESGWPYQVIEKGSFSVANFTVSKKIINSNKYGGITIRGEIQNLFDKDYEYVQGYPMPGISFYLGLRYDY